ncbi:hypothetical protein [Spirillospora sp. CA-294931]|uniref:hypothetical protein n=1 Tax=Spirillospora sp. CA-294931 TaxID=3240042 RepID=UPI003D8E78D6
MEEPALLPPPTSWPYHAERFSLLLATLAADIELQIYGNRWHEHLTGQLLETVPEWQVADVTFAEWANAAPVVKQLRTLLEAAQNSRNSLQQALDEVSADIRALPVPGYSERAAGYRAGLADARRTIARRAEQRETQTLTDLLEGRAPARPGPRQRLPTPETQIHRFTEILRARFRRTPLDVPPVAERLQQALAYKAPQPYAYKTAHTQWKRHYTEFIALKGQLTPILAFATKDQNPGWLAEELTDLATALLPSQAAQSADPFPTGFHAATLRAVKLLNTHAKRHR